MATAYALIPAAAGSYVYNEDSVVAEISSGTTFKWYNFDVDVRRYNSWIALAITADDAAAANRLADTQTTRVSTGLYPFYLKEAQ